MTYRIDSPTLGIPSIDTVGDAAALPVLSEVDAADPTYGAGRFIYLKGAANTAVGSWVTYASDGSTALAAANAVGPVATAMSAAVADKYGWYQIVGFAVGKVLAGFAANATPYLTSTAGSLDDTAVAGDYVHGAAGVSAIGTPSAGLATFQINRPFVSNGIDDATA